MTIHIGDVVGDYRVIGIAGTGGMGEVYRIEHRITRRVEAMKLLPPGLCDDPEQVSRFEREIQVQARLHHPNIVALYNAVRDARSIALVMEFVEGESLRQILAAGPLPVKIAVDYARQMLSALACAHAAGVIHRDVAPSNIIVTLDGTVKLSDFGLARAETDLRLTSAGVPAGSPWYMSPEQVRGIDPVDCRTDIYAVGAVLHEMLTGAKMFDGDGAFAVMRAQVEATPAAPGSLNPVVPPALDEIVLRAVAKDPAQRFQSADEFRLALEQAVPNCKPLPVPAAASPARTAFRDWSSLLAGLQASRTPILMVLVPAVLVAGLFAIRPQPAAPRLRPASAATARRGGTAPVVAPPPAAPSAEALTTAAVPLQPAPAVRPAAAAAPATPRKASPAAGGVARPAAKPAASYALRVTGAELTPASTTPDRAPATVAAEPPVNDPPAPVPAATLPAAPPLAEDAGASPDAAPAKPQKGGNRLVRALGKINPFRKGPKDQ